MLHQNTTDEDEEEEEEKKKKKKKKKKKLQESHLPDLPVCTNMCVCVCVCVCVCGVIESIGCLFQCLTES